MRVGTIGATLCVLAGLCMVAGLAVDLDSTEAKVLMVAAAVLFVPHIELRKTMEETAPNPELLREAA